MDNQTIDKDVWFDNVQVLHYNTQVLEENHYYPFGLTLSAAAMGSVAQPFKYQTKELEKSFGLEIFDFNARMYEPQLGRTWQPDPMAEMRSWTSPYSWVQNNPILRIDPTGAIDGIVFGSDGEDRGETKDGVHGSAIIYDGKLDFKNMTDEQLLNSGDGAETFDNYASKMDYVTQAKVITGLTRNADGMQVKNRTFKFDVGIDEKIWYGGILVQKLTAAKKKIPNFKTSLGLDNKALIEYTAQHLKHYATTFANITASVVIHEYNGHWKEGYMDERNTHYKAYLDVINHPIWEKTINEFKAFYMENYKYYLEVETDQELDSKMQKLYDQYKPYYRK